MAEESEYLIIGNGRLARHLKHYFKLAGVDFLHWSRSDNLPLKVVISKSKKILLAISDSSIEPFVEEWKDSVKSWQIFIHFSGSISCTYCQSAHPLMTFSERLYTREFYESIPFITEKGKMSFGELFPQLKNPSFEIESEQKSLYHALCVIGGNFPVILWQQFRYEMAKNFKIPAGALIPYLRKSLENFITEENSLTGPLVRRDYLTIEKHRKALERSSMLNIYNSFVEFYFNEKFVGKGK